MGGIMDRNALNKSEVIVLAEQNDDRIILVEQMWKYKRDFSKYLGVKHGFVVTTTAKGERTKRDIILDRNKHKSTRVMKYNFHGKHDNVYSRIKVPPVLTENELQEKLDEMNNIYDATENNCWHWSHKIVDALEGNTDLHPYLRLLDGFHSSLSPFISYDKLKGISKYVSEILANN
ncbi:hypothetical protein SteCoe_35152 [Stentor coeruleus]|uniref:PPPDE domain-containing protein n=1 Tax=Stentor coeruleus TaxID=5963 RepID=A0A1R2ASX9_9CILI|nr:hypothetical protein SteCoe_35152 [Stentor coeruleus]